MSIAANPVKNIVREMIKHEDELTNERLTWLGQFEGLLFVAYGLAVKDLNDPVLTWVVCSLGLLIAVSVLFATWRADKATGELAKQWDWHKGSLEGDCWEPDVQGIRGDKLRQKLLWPGRFLPILFALAWLAIGIRQVVHPAAAIHSPLPWHF
jgi:hypothetical protein